jgi:hypothetical protein
MFALQPVSSMAVHLISGKPNIASDPIKTFLRKYVLSAEAPLAPINDQKPKYLVDVLPVSTMALKVPIDN